MQDPSIDQSISDCTTSLRILNYCSRIVQQNMANKLKKPSSPPSDPFADSSSNTTTPKIKDESAIASSISFRESEWIIAQVNNDSKKNDYYYYYYLFSLLLSLLSKYIHKNMKKKSHSYSLLLLLTRK